ncbi:MAG: CheY-like chemotaxis protein [Motiliproteus sp.]|jgi:CheY-like chemotaxis protein
MKNYPLTTGEIAKYCGVNFRTVIRWIEKDYLISFKLPGRGDNRVTPENFVSFLMRNDMPVPRGFSSYVKKVLVVDDDPGMSGMIQRILIRNDYEVRVADNGFQAGSLMTEFRPALVILDLQMPGLSGFQVLKHIRDSEELAATRVLVISGLGDAGLNLALEAGADDVLSKPFDGTELWARVQTLLPQQHSD